MVDQWLKLLLICLVVVTNSDIVRSTYATEKGAGQVQEIGGLKCYVTGPKDSKIAVMLVSDIFGFEVPHLREIADKVGAAGFYTVVPDFFHGDPYVSDDPNKLYQDWIKKHRAEKGIIDAKAVINALKSKGITKIGASGFCWGGKVVVDLTKCAKVKPAVLLHPTDVWVADIKRVKVPISILGGENDTLCSPTKLKSYESALKSKPEIDSFVKVFPGAEHGWTTRYNDNDAVAVERAREAHECMLHWLVKYLS